MALLTWAQIANLNNAPINLGPAKQAVMAEFEVLGAATEPGGTPVLTTNTTPEYAKKIVNFFDHDLRRLRQAYEGALYVLQRMRNDAAQSADAAVPEGDL